MTTVAMSPRDALGLVAQADATPTGVLTPEVESSHRRLSRASLLFVREAVANAALQRRESFAPVHRTDPHVMPEAHQSWPTFLNPATAARLSDATLAVSRLVRRVPAELFAGRRSELAAFYSLEGPSLAAVLLTAPTGADSAIGRGDFIDSGGDLKCLEFNLYPTLGGWQTGTWAQRHLAVPLFADFVARQGLELGWIDSMEVLLHHILADTQRQVGPADGRVNIVFAVDEKVPDAMAAAVEEHINSSYAPRLSVDGARLGSAWFCDWRRLVVGRGGVALDGQPVHAVVEFYHHGTPPALYRCFKRRLVTLYNGPIAELIGDKRNLALLSEAAEAGMLSEADAETVDRHIPWSRVVGDRSVSFHGERGPLLEIAQEAKDDLVLKAGLSSHGDEVYIGRHTPQREWRERLSQAASQGGWLLQEHVDSLPYLYQHGEEGLDVHSMVWGLFAFGDAYAGGFVRMLPRRIQGIINTARGATEGTLFTVREDPVAPPAAGNPPAAELSKEQNP